MGVETRSMVPGHYLRGGSPCAYDRVLASELGTYAAWLIENGIYGVTVAEKHGEITHNKLCDIAGIAKPVPLDDQMVKTAKSLGISFCC